MTVEVPMKQEQAEKVLPNGWQWVKLKDVCSINPRRPSDLNCAEDSPITFLPMPSIDAISGKIGKPEIKPFHEVKKGYTYFQKDDVLFAKITPCMENGKHAIASNLINDFGFGTTEFHVIRPTNKIASEWIHYFLRQPKILQEATGYFTGSVGQQRVPTSYLEDLQIPLPSLEEQRKIVGILKSKMEAIAAARKATLAQIEAAEALPAAYLRQVFESPEAQQWERKTLGDIALIIQNGVYKSSENYGHGYPFLRMYNIRNTSWNLDLKTISQVSLNESELKKFQLNTGDLLISRVNSFELVGKCGWVSPEAEKYIFENMIIRVRLKDDVDSLFIAQQMGHRSIKLQIQGVAKQAIGQASINSKDLRNITVILPSLKKQKYISEMINKKIEQKELLEGYLLKQLEAINALPAAILRQAFNGEL